MFESKGGGKTPNFLLESGVISNNHRDTYGKEMTIIKRNYVRFRKKFAFKKDFYQWNFGFQKKVCTKFFLV